MQKERTTFEKNRFRIMDVGEKDEVEGLFGGFGGIDHLWFGISVVCWEEGPRDPRKKENKRERLPVSTLKIGRYL